MSQTIELPDDLYGRLHRRAQAEGLTVAAWIASALPASPAEQQSLPEMLAGLVGAIDSSRRPKTGYPRTPFGDQVASKLERQGLRRP